MLVDHLQRRVTLPSVTHPRLSDRQLVLLVLFVHGPGDVVTTAMLWSHEANPAVRALGFGPWLVVKGLLLAAFVIIWRHAAPHPQSRLVLVVLLTVGVAVVLNNAAAVALAALAA